MIYKSIYVLLYLLAVAICHNNYVYRKDSSRIVYCRRHTYAIMFKIIFKKYKKFVYNRQARVLIGEAIVKNLYYFIGSRFS